MFEVRRDWNTEKMGRLLLDYKRSEPLDTSYAIEIPEAELYSDAQDH
jgi:hypothetical protein